MTRALIGIFFWVIVVSSGVGGYFLSMPAIIMATLLLVFLIRPAWDHVHPGCDGFGPTTGDWVAIFSGVAMWFVAIATRLVCGTVGFTGTFSSWENFFLR